MPKSQNREPPLPSIIRCPDCPRLAESEWHVLEEEDQSRLSEAKSVRSFAKGGVIFHQGASCDGIYCVQSGTVGMRKTDEKGNAVLLYLVHPGQTMGMRSFFAGTDYRASAEALGPATVCYIPINVLKDLAVRNPKLDLAFLEHIAKELGQAHDTILANTSLSVRSRMAHLLLGLKKRYGRKRPDGAIEMELPMTRHDIADLLATRPETVARTITALTNDGLIQLSGRQAVLLDLEGLREEAEAFEE